MEKIDFQKEEIPFTQVANGLIYDKRISLGAKTIYAYMYSKPNGWQFSAHRIGQELSVSRNTVLNHLNELKENGYLISQKLSDGRMLYRVVFPPIDPQSKNYTLAEKPQSKKATVQKSHGAEFGPISNKDVNSNKEIILNTSNPIGLQINQVIDSFKQVNSTYQKWFANKSQRKSIENLINLHGVELVTKVIAILPQTNKRPYTPSIYTPMQLEQKWDQLKDSLSKNKLSGNYQVGKV